MKYLVQLTEMLQRHFIVEADTATESHDIMEDIYVNIGIDLDYDDYANTKIAVVGEVNESSMGVYEQLN